MRHPGNGDIVRRPKWQSHLNRRGHNKKLKRRERLITLVEIQPALWLRCFIAS